MVVSATQAGEQLRCECGANVVAPNMRGLRELQPASEPKGVPAPARSPGRSLGSDAVFAACLFLLVLTLIALVPLGLVWMQLDTSFTMETDVQYGNEQIDLLPIDQTWEVWKEFQSTGLQAREVPFYTRTLQYSTIVSRVILGLSILAGLSILGLVISGWQSTRARAKRSRTRP